MKKAKITRSNEDKEMLNIISQDSKGEKVLWAVVHCDFLEPYDLSYVDIENGDYEITLKSV